MRAPRILVCSDTWLPQVNGVSIVAGRTLHGLRERGWTCGLIAPQYRAPPGEPADVEVLALPAAAVPGYPDLRLAWPTRKVERFMRWLDPDLVLIETEASIGRMAQRAAARLGIPTVSAYHTDFARYTTAYGWPRLAPAVRRYLGRFHQRSARVMTPSVAAATDLLALGVPNAVVWGRGVDARTFSPARRSQARRESFGFGSRFTFVHVGRFAAEKNVELILEAYAEASARLPRGVVHLVLAGSGPREPLLRSIAPLGVSFLGWLDRETTLPDLYANADAFVFASTTETLGLVVLEAMASGLPVVAAPAGGVAEHLRDGINGIAYPADDAAALADVMLELAGDPRRAIELRAAARQTAAALDWEPELDRLDDLLRGVIGAAPAAVAPGDPAAGPAPVLRMA